VIARFADEEEHPAIVERPFGLGTVITLATSADKEWHLWPDHPTYLPIMMEIVQASIRRDQGGGGVHVGETIHVQVDPAQFEPDVLVRTPAYPSEREVGVTALPAGDGRGLSVAWEYTETAGIYQFVLRGREGRDRVRLVAVNPDARESDLTRAGEDALRQAAGELPIDYIRGVEQLTDTAGEARTELWRVFLFAAVLVLMAEQMLAWLWGRRR
jgi:hypothetical protein